jgi:hypothetical protein
MDSTSGCIGDVSPDTSVGSMIDPTLDRSPTACGEHAEMGGQVSAVPVTIERITRDPAFTLGVADVRAGLPFRKAYETWGTNDQRGPGVFPSEQRLRQRSLRLNRRRCHMAADTHPRFAKD